MITILKVYIYGRNLNKDCSYIEDYTDKIVVTLTKKYCASENIYDLTYQNFAMST